MGIFTSRWENIICKCGKPAKMYDMWCDCPCHESEREKEKQRQINRDTPYYGDVKKSRRLLNKIRNKVIK